MDIRQHKTVVTKVIIAILLILFFGGTLFPIYWMFSTSIKPTVHVFDLPPEVFPSTPTFEHYIGLDEGSIKVSVFFMNSVINSVGTVLLALAVGILAAYALSRVKFRFRKAIAVGILTTQMFPLVVLLIPLYLLYKNLHLLNTYQGLILAFTSFTLPFSIWMLKGYIDSVPVELEESAFMDGCSRWQILSKILLPLIMPGVVATGVFAFLDAWNNLLFPLMLVSKPGMKTLPPGMILAFSGEFKHDWGGMMATSVIVSLPVVVAFVMLQRFLIEGLTRGAIKG